MTFRFALLGAGRIGRVHGRAIAAVPGCRLAVVADAMAEAAAAVASEHGATVAEIDDIAADPAIDGVLIATPTDTHAPLIEQFARAKKPIFCEKPIDLDIARVRRCLDVVDAENGRLMLGFNRRFDAQFRALRQAIDDGRIGRVETVTIISRDPGPPPIDYITRSGGLFKDMMIHDFDMARFLLGEAPSHVSAQTSVLVDPNIGDAGDVDTASVLLRTPSGRQAMITNSRRSGYGYDQRVDVHGSKGAATVDNQRPVSVDVATNDGFLRPPLHDFFMTRYADAYAVEIAAFVAAVKDGTAMEPTGADGLAALALAEAANRAAAEGRTVAVDEVLT